MGYLFRRVARSDLDRFWPRASKLLNPAIRRTGGQFTADGILVALRAGRMQLWLTGDADNPIAAAATAILDYPGIRVLSVPLLGGSRYREWIDELQSSLNAYGRLSKCLALEAYVRPGFIGASYNESRAVLKKVEKHWTLIRRAIPPEENTDSL